MFATLAGLLSAALTFLPRFSLVTSSPLDRRLPLSTPIQIQNAGYFPVRDLKVGLALGRLDFGGGSGIGNGTDGYGSVFMYEPWSYQSFSPTETIEISFQDLIKADPGLLESGRVEIVIRYKPILLPWTRERRYRLVTAKGTDGNTYWKQTPRD